ncbi:MAG TPA: hypothetical protein VE954_17885 [Oligoflexus sp.]|uniref:hypothetical protein n=1 Tax=Oligoflexus sp. TaxID=1971216 RepID=UPI002D6781BB|nr:hypothetical protein [Oligoflexus sp.]HYX34970.1 hypothetical protein [Oligoflexus sp.]
MSFLRILGFFWVAAFTWNHGLLYGKEYKEHEINWEPLKKRPELYQEYWGIYGDGKEQKTLTRAQMARSYEITESVLKSNPRWVDGYWILGSTAFQWASSFNEEKDLPLAREIFLKGKKATESCLKIEPNQPLCKLFLGSAIGSIGSIDGILSSLKNAKTVEKLWVDVLNSNVNYHFYPHITMQGSVRYGLGMFYRLVPDMWLIHWLFDVRGSLDKSIKLHREGIALDGTNACSDIMLAVSLICKAKGDRKSSQGQEGFALLDKAARANTENINLKLCVTDAQKVAQDPSRACGYTTTKQQDVSEEAVKSQNKT